MAPISVGQSPVDRVHRRRSRGTGQHLGNPPGELTRQRLRSSATDQETKALRTLAAVHFFHPRGSSTSFVFKASAIS